MKILLDRRAIFTIPKEFCPMIVLSYGIGDPIATAITMKEKGFYNHIMWLLKPGVLASQALTFKAIPVDLYLKRHTLKFVYNENWTDEDRENIRRAILIDLAKPVYKRLYDPVAIIGQLLNFESLQIPGLDICSDSGKYIKVVKDNKFDLKHPSPTNINNWIKSQPPERGWKVYGRYRPD